MNSKRHHAQGKRSGALVAVTALIPIGLAACTQASFDLQDPQDSPIAEDTAPVADTQSGSVDDTKSDAGAVPDLGIAIEAAPGIDALGIDSPDSPDIMPLGADSSITPPVDASGDTAFEVTIPTVDAGPCAYVTAATAEVYVDGASAKPSRGSSDCPFHSIAEATGLAAPVAGSRRTIHVEGGGSGTTSRVYSESVAIEVKPGVLLTGAGTKATRIQNGGVCPGGGMCVVHVDAGGAFEGFTVSASTGGTAIVTGAGSTRPIVRNAVATSATSSNYGLLVRDGADLGPDLSVSNNATIGVDCNGSGVVRVIGGGANHFDSNGQTGIFVEGTAQLQFEQGTANGNAVGIKLATTSAVMHSIRALSATLNTRSGITVTAAASLSLRNASLLQNRVGLIFIQGALNTLDLGTGTDLGKNVLGSVTSASRNTVTGICVDLQRPIAAVGDLWSACAPSTGTVSGCDLPSAPSYMDVLLRASSGSSIDLAACGSAP